ncbi:MAG: MgtC/SapB family protein [Verrucomicrobia bacterium]|nr:MgtC/SapB family protein [Verrucomicrobiota bacterium]
MSTLLVSIIVSACLGALVGLIRQWSDQTSSPTGEVDLGGVRTFTFWAMLGCVGAFLNEAHAPMILAGIVVLVGLHQIVSMARLAAAPLPGGTTFASTLLTVLVGALVYWDYQQAAVLIAATTMVMLGLKQTLHAWTRAFKIEDIRATLQFVAITGVILPLVPNRSFGPYDAFNPYATWLLVVLISGLGFAGYVTMRLLGARAGIMLTSLFGGLASSTATTLAFSRRSRDEPALSEHYAMAVVTACSVMLPRVIIATSVVSPELGFKLVVPFAVMALPALAYGIWLWFARRPGLSVVETPKLTNPLSLKTAIKFALLYALIGFLVKAATHLDLLQHGLLPLSFVSGLTDMDAISLSMAGNQNAGTVSLTLATKAVIVAAVANSLLKAAFAATLGSSALRRETTVVLGTTALAGLAALWLV